MDTSYGIQNSITLIIIDQLIIFFAKIEILPPLVSLPIDYPKMAAPLTSNEKIGLACARIDVARSAPDAEIGELFADAARIFTDRPFATTAVSQRIVLAAVHGLLDRSLLYVRDAAFEDHIVKGIETIFTHDPDNPVCVAAQAAYIDEAKQFSPPKKLVSMNEMEAMIKRMRNIIRMATCNSVDEMIETFSKKDRHKLDSFRCTDGVTRTRRELFTKLLEDLPEMAKEGVMMKRTTLKNGDNVEIYFEVSEDCPGVICWTNKTTGERGDFAHFGQCSVRGGSFSDSDKFVMPAQAIEKIESGECEDD